MIRENLEEREGEGEKRGLEAGLVAEKGRLKKGGGWQGKGCGDITLGAGGVADGRRQRSAGEGKRSGGRGLGVLLLDTVWKIWEVGGTLGARRVSWSRREGGRGRVPLAPLQASGCHWQIPSGAVAIVLLFRLGAGLHIGQRPLR